MLVQYDNLLNKLKSILKERGFSESDSYNSAKIFTDNSLDGVYSHGYMRFLTVISYIDKGYIDVEKKATKISGFNAFECFDGNLGMGNLNATICMDRAISLSEKFGIGIVSLKNTNHWMRGGTYGWQAANKGFIGICFSNTIKNMPAWGGVDKKLGNNPLVIAVPRSNGNHVVLDAAMSLFSYGKIEEYRKKGLKLPFCGGYDSNGNLTDIPEEVEKTERILPAGYWKGSSISILLDLVASVLSGGNSVTKLSENNIENALSQIFIAINPKCIEKEVDIDSIIDEVLRDIKSSKTIKENSEILYPGERVVKTREYNTKNGIPVIDDYWEKICNL